MRDILGTILDMSNAGYDDSAILATIRSRLESEQRTEDEYWDAREVEADRAARVSLERRELAALVGSASDPFESGRAA